MERRKKITQPENCWSLRNHRAAENKKTEREMETQTSGSQEKRGERVVRRHSMTKLKPCLSCDPDDPVKIDSDVKKGEILPSKPSSCSQEHTTSLTSRYQQLKT
ncbi:hypothetical protein ABG768_014791 [Culter alburnus]|uniref:Uncharacterized protein n=1 Tax=Culter alburnus TaxID=194366 RepID=A0AAW1Z370_CULAL